MTLLGLGNATRHFGDLVAADDVSLSIEAGEFFALSAPSGSPLMDATGPNSPNLISSGNPDRKHRRG
jgi:hypothetical protein